MEIIFFIFYSAEEKKKGKGDDFFINSLHLISIVGTSECVPLCPAHSFKKIPN